MQLPQSKRDSKPDQSSSIFSVFSDSTYCTKVRVRADTWSLGEDMKPATREPNGGNDSNLGAVCVLGFKCERFVNEMILVRESMICYRGVNISFYIDRTIPFPWECYIPMGGGNEIGLISLCGIKIFLGIFFKTIYQTWECKIPISHS